MLLAWFLSANNIANFTKFYDKFTIHVEMQAKIGNCWLFYLAVSFYCRLIYG